MQKLFVFVFLALFVNGSLLATKQGPIEMEPAPVEQLTSGQGNAAVYPREISAGTVSGVFLSPSGNCICYLVQEGFSPKKGIEVFLCVADLQGKIKIKVPVAFSRAGILAEWSFSDKYLMVNQLTRRDVNHLFILDVETGITTDLTASPDFQDKNVVLLKASPLHKETVLVLVTGPESHYKILKINIKTRKIEKSIQGSGNGLPPFLIFDNDFCLRLIALFEKEGEEKLYEAKRPIKFDQVEEKLTQIKEGSEKAHLRLVKTSVGGVLGSFSFDPDNKILYFTENCAGAFQILSYDTEKKQDSVLFKVPAGCIPTYIVGESETGAPVGCFYTDPQGNLNTICFDPELNEDFANRPPLQQIFFQMKKTDKQYTGLISSFNQIFVFKKEEGQASSITPLALQHPLSAKHLVFQEHFDRLPNDGQNFRYLMGPYSSEGVVFVVDGGYWGQSDPLFELYLHWLVNQGYLVIHASNQGATFSNFPYIPFGIQKTVLGTIDSLKRWAQQITPHPKFFTLGHSFEVIPLEEATKQFIDKRNITSSSTGATEPSTRDRPHGGRPRQDATNEEAKHGAATGSQAS
jgi:hypothetical protein